MDIVSKTDVSDTSYIDKGGFGKVFYYIKCYGHNNYSTVSGGDPGQAGKSLDLKSINAVQYVPENNSFYFNKSIRLDGASLKVMAQGTGDIWVSRSGKLAVSNGATAAAEYHYPPHSFTLVDPLTLQPVSQTRNTDELLGYYSVNEGLVISETGCCLYGGSKLVNNSRSGVIAGILVRLNPYGLIPQDPVVNIGSDGSGSISRQTDEGEYILYSGTLGLPGYDFMYNLTGGKLKRLYTASGEFLPSGKEYISTSYGSASVCRCKDNVFVRSFSTASATRSFSVDPVTGYLAIMTTDSRLMIYDPSNGKLMKDIRLPDGNIQHFLANSVLFSGKGYYYKLSFN